jgi:hypothetical protein
VPEPSALKQSTEADLGAQVLQLQCELEAERERRAFFERANAMLELRVKTLERDVEQLSRILRDESVHDETRRSIVKLEAQMVKEREMAARARESLSRKNRDLQERLDAVLKNASGKGIEATRQAPGGARMESGPPLDFSSRSPKARERPTETPRETNVMEPCSFESSLPPDRSPGHCPSPTTAASPIQGLQTPPPLRCEQVESLSLSANTTEEPSSCIAAAPVRCDATASPPTASVADSTLLQTRPQNKEDESGMLIAAAVTMAPPEERAEFLSSLSERERAGALRFMDPADLADALEMCTDSSGLLREIPLPILGSCFARMQPRGRHTLLQQCVPTRAAELLALLDARQGKLLLSDLRPKFRAEVMERLPMTWLEGAASETDLDLIAVTLKELPSESRDALIAALPRGKRLQDKEGTASCSVLPTLDNEPRTPSNVNASVMSGAGHCSLLIPEDNTQ